MSTIGFDEVGRGCLCGPVTAACVLFPHNINLDARLLADSKALRPQRREYLAEIIRKECHWALGWVYPHKIDRINIHNASLLAMEQAFAALLTQYYTPSTKISSSTSGIATGAFIPEAHTALVDGKYCPSLVYNTKPIACQAIIKGDTKIAEIKAASILAKTARDAHMQLLDRAFPQYGIANHKGYPTSFHKKAILLHGITSNYRKSFKMSYNTQ